MSWSSKPNTSTLRCIFSLAMTATALAGFSTNSSTSGQNPAVSLSWLADQLIPAAQASDSETPAFSAGATHVTRKAQSAYNAECKGTKEQAYDAFKQTFINMAATPDTFKFPNFSDVKISPAPDCGFVIDSHLDAANDKGDKLHLEYYALMSEQNGEFQLNGMYDKENYVSYEGFLENIKAIPPELMKGLTFREDEHSPLREAFGKVYKASNPARGLEVQVVMDSNIDIAKVLVLRFSDAEANFDGAHSKAEYRKNIQLALDMMSAMTPKGLSAQEKEQFWSAYKDVEDQSNAHYAQTYEKRAFAVGPFELEVNVIAGKSPDVYIQAVH